MARPPLATYSPDAEIAHLRQRLAAAEAHLLAQRQQVVTSELTLGMLHRLNNVLTGIYLLAEQRGPGALPPETAELLLASAREAREVVARTSELNTVTAVEDASYFEVGALLQQQLECVKIILPQSAALAFEPAAEPFYVRISGVEFRAIILALALQARRAIAAATHPRLRLAVAPGEDFAPVLSSPLTSAGAGVAVRFSDNGRGLPADDLEPVFEPSFPPQVDAAKLGLFHARQLAGQHGGSLHALPLPPRQGAEFVLLLPRVRLEETGTADLPL